MKIGIASTVREPGWETQELARAAHAAHHEVLTFRAIDVTYAFNRGVAKPTVRLNTRNDRHNLCDLEMLIVRGTKGAETAVALLAQTLAAQNVRISDPLDRFAVADGKLSTTLRRWRAGYGSDSYVAFTRRGVQRIFADTQFYPLLYKPVDGRHGDGVVKLNSRQAANDWLAALPATEEKCEPFLFQKCMEFTREFRSLVVNGEILATVEKRKDGAAWNREHEPRGARFEYVDLPAASVENITRAIVASTPRQGVFGVDIGVTRDDQIHIIEENYAPEWEQFQAAMRMRHPEYDTAASIIARLTQAALPAAAPAPAPAPQPAAADEPALTAAERATLRRLIALLNIN